MSCAEKTKFRHVIECGDYTFKTAVASECTGAGYKDLQAVVKTDRYGGHRHEWVVNVNGEERLRTESLIAAIRAYNEVNNEQ